LKEEALAAFERGLQQFPKDLELLQEYVHVLLRIAEQGDHTAEIQSISLLKTVISVDNSQSEPFYQLGSLELSKGNAQEAVELLKRAAELDPKASKVRFALSRAYRRLGRQEDADKEFQLYESLKSEEEASGERSRPEARSRVRE